LQGAEADLVEEEREYLRNRTRQDAGHASMRATTILAVSKDGHTTLAADGQVTLGDIVVKHTAQKLRRLAGGKVIAGFAGATADAHALFAKFETKLEANRGNLERAAVELAQDWRTDRVLRSLDALLLVADAEHLYVLSGDGDVIQPEDGVMAIGSGGPFAMAAARALYNAVDLSSRQIAEAAMSATADLCIYTNHQVAYEEVSAGPLPASGGDGASVSHQ